MKKKTIDVIDTDNGHDVESHTEIETFVDPENPQAGEGADGDTEAKTGTKKEYREIANSPEMELSTEPQPAKKEVPTQETENSEIPENVLKTFEKVLDACRECTSKKDFKKDIRGNVIQKKPGEYFHFDPDPHTGGWKIGRVFPGGA